MRKLIKKGDIILLIIFTLAAILIACIPFFRTAQAEGSDSVVISIAGEVYGTWPLSENRTIRIENSFGMNEVTIEGGTVAVTKSDCANQICVDTGAIRSPGQMIVCLPHRLVIEIHAAEGSSSEDQYDAIAR